MKVNREDAKRSHVSQFIMIVAISILSAVVCAQAMPVESDSLRVEPEPAEPITLLASSSLEQDCARIASWRTGLFQFEHPFPATVFDALGAEYFPLREQAQNYLQEVARCLELEASHLGEVLRIFHAWEGILGYYPQDAERSGRFRMVVEPIALRVGESLGRELAEFFVEYTVGSPLELQRLRIAAALRAALSSVGTSDVTVLERAVRDAIRNLDEPRPRLIDDQIRIHQIEFDNVVATSGKMRLESSVVGAVFVNDWSFTLQSPARNQAPQHAEIHSDSGVVWLSLDNFPRDLRRDFYAWLGIFDDDQQHYLWRTILIKCVASSVRVAEADRISYGGFSFEIEVRTLVRVPGFFELPQEVPESAEVLRFSRIEEIIEALPRLLLDGWRDPATTD